MTVKLRPKSVREWWSRRFIRARLFERYKDYERYKSYSAATFLSFRPSPSFPVGMRLKIYTMLDDQKTVLLSTDSYEIPFENSARRSV